MVRCLRCRYICNCFANPGLDGHYLNLPVMNEGGEIVGMVDVLKLTYATLEQVLLAYITDSRIKC